MTNKKVLLVFLFFLIYPFIVTSSLSVGSFVEYKVYYKNYQANAILIGLEIENVTNIFSSNSSFKFILWYINLNSSYYFPPGTNYDTLPYPKNFFYMPDVGKITLNRTVKLTLYNFSDGFYIYKGLQCLASGNYIVWIFYVNSSGVPSEIYSYQYIGDKLVSNTTYVLFRSNIILSSETIYFPSNITMVTGKPIPLYVGNIIFYSPLGSIEALIIGVGAISVLIILLFRRSENVR